MSPETTLRHALRCLAHPLALLAASLLLLNALVLQPNWPSWWTGKLGDLAWLALAPLLAALLFAALWPRRAWAGPRVVGVAAVVITGLAFGLVKIVPAVNAWVVTALARLGYGAKLAPDPTDLLALPGLWAAWWVWGQGNPRPLPRPARLAGLALAVLAVAADAAGAVNLGVECVGQDSAGLLAVTTTTPAGYFSPYVVRVVRSADGGLTWAEEAAEEVSSGNLAEGPRLRCAANPWPLASPQEAGQVFYWVEGGGLYRSDDGGQTLTQEKAASGLPAEARSAVIDAGTGHLVLAGGLSGVLVRLPDGAWQTVAVPLGPGR